jgi:hypothetical protein
VALSHLDLTPDNAVLVRDRVALIDFEDAAFRHIGLDAALLGAYRRVLATRLILDDGAFDDVLAVGTAVIAARRAVRLPRISAPDQPASLAHRRRLQLAHTLESAEPRISRRFPQLGAWFASLADAARMRWPEARMEPPRFRAFAR